MSNVSDKSCRENQNTFCVQQPFFFENRAVYEIMWKYIVGPGRAVITIWRMHIACWIPKATNIHSEDIILLFYFNSGCTNAPQCYVISTLPILLTFFWGGGVTEFGSSPEGGKIQIMYWIRLTILWTILVCPYQPWYTDYDFLLYISINITTNTFFHVSVMAVPPVQTHTSTK